MKVVWIDPFAPVNVSHPLLEVQFSAEELEKCRAFAHHRNDAKMDAGIGDRTDYSGDWSRNGSSVALWNRDGSASRGLPG